MFNCADFVPCWMLMVPFVWPDVMVQGSLSFRFFILLRIPSLCSITLLRGWESLSTRALFSLCMFLSVCFCLYSPIFNQLARKGMSNNMSLSKLLCLVRFLVLCDRLIKWPMLHWWESQLSHSCWLCWPYIYVCRVEHHHDCLMHPLK